MGNTPNVRFKGFTEDWEQRKLGDVYNFQYGEFNNNPDNGGEYPIYGANGIIGGYTKYNAEDSAIIGHMGAYAGYVVWASGKHFVTYNGTIARPSDDSLDSKFGYYMLSQKQIYRICAGSGQPFVSYADLNGIDIKIPIDKNEQEKIGVYFSTLDRLITLHQQKCDETKELKKYMLQNMFPQKDEKVPKIRFDGFTGEWEQRKFDDLADYKKGPFGSALKKDMFVPKSDMTVKVYEQQNAINKDWHLERYFITEEYANKLSGFRVEGGDIIVSCAGTIGETYEIPLDADPGIINQALMRIKVKESIVNKKMFNILFTNMIDDFTRVHSNGSAIKNIPPFSDLKPMVVFVPKMDEQNKISSYFSNLDHLITLHQQKCNALKEFKKYMLQNMFPQKGENKCQN